MTEGSSPRVRTRGRAVVVSREDIQEIVRLHNMGQSYSAISTLTGYSRWTVDRILKESRGETMYRQEGRTSIPSHDTRTVATFMSDLESELAAAVDETEVMTGALIRYTGELQRLCDSAMQVSEMYKDLEVSISTFETMKQRLDSYKSRIEKLDQVTSGDHS